MSHFAKALRETRERHGFSQAGLAREAGLHHSLISRFESAKRDPSAYTVRRLAKAMGASMADRDRLLIAAGFVPPEDQDKAAEYDRTEPEVHAIHRMVNAMTPGSHEYMEARAVLRSAVYALERLSNAGKRGGARVVTNTKTTNGGPWDLEDLFSKSPS